MITSKLRSLQVFHFVVLVLAHTVYAEELDTQDEAQHTESTAKQGQNKNFFSTPGQDDVKRIIFSSLGAKSKSNFAKTNKLNRKLFEEELENRRKRFPKLLEEFEKERHSKGIRTSTVLDDAILMNRPDILEGARLFRPDLKPSGGDFLSSTNIAIFESVKKAIKDRNLTLLEEICAHPYLKELNSPPDGLPYLLRQKVDVDTLKILIKAGADLNVQGPDGRTPLHNAIIYDGDEAKFKALLEGGANPDLRDKFKKSVRDIAKTYSELERTARWLDLLNKYHPIQEQIVPSVPPQKNEIGNNSLNDKKIVSGLIKWLKKFTDFGKKLLGRKNPPAESIYSGPGRENSDSVAPNSSGNGSGNRSDLAQPAR